MRQLRYWTGADPDRMERLFSLSALAQREKWKNRPDYRRRHTINNALKAGGKVYEPEKHRPRKTTSVRDRLRERAAYATLAHPWKEKAGRADAAASARFIYGAVLRLAWKANREEIDLGRRECAEEAGVSDKTALEGLRLLEDLHGLVEKVRDGDNASAARYRLKTVPKLHHTEIGKKLLALNPPV